jgi:FtsP/CotA-like multicopper oxidase with cupredoxin domain
MSHGPSRTTRREFLRAAGLGAFGTVAAGALAGAGSRLLLPSAAAFTTQLALAASDGWITMPGRDAPIYIFGFVKVDPAASVATLQQTYKGHMQHTAPTIDVKQEDDIKITLTNLGLTQRPDLTDPHTIHWHGFDVPSPLNDGVPEVSIGVPIGQQFTYFYRPHRAGTYMYHCHNEDVEHVQMGMSGIVFVRPLQDGNTTLYRSGKYAYNDGDGSTGYDRHYAILLNEIEERQHDADRDIQEFIMTSHDPQFFTLNGRSYPQTVLPHGTAVSTINPLYGNTEYSQPNSSLIQANPGERILLRLANLGYLQHTMELPGIAMKVIGQDASLLRNGSVDTSYRANSLLIGPGEARDVLFTAPAFSSRSPSGIDGRGNYNVYYFKNRDWRKLSNHGLPGPGGMMTEVRVYETALPPQVNVSDIYV